MKIKVIFTFFLVLIMLAYLYTMHVVKTGMQDIITNDMRVLSGVLYSANIVLLDVEQDVEKKYANILYEAALNADKKGLIENSEVDGIYLRDSNRFMSLKGEKYENTIKECTDTVVELPRALFCRGFYIYIHPSKKGEVIVSVKKSRVEMEKSRIGLDRLFEELSKIGLFFYIALQNDKGVAYSTIDSRLLSGFNRDSVLRDVYINGQEITRNIDVFNRKVIETVIPFSYGNFRGIMRVGIDGSEYIEMQKKVSLELSILYGFLLLVLLAVYILIYRIRKVEASYTALKGVLSRTTIPIVFKNGASVQPLNPAGEKFRDMRREWKDGNIVEAEGIRYIVKSMGSSEGTYYLFISLENEDVKKKLMEYEAISNIIGEVAHEIKNPLNGISLLIQSMKAEEDREEYKDILEQVDRIEESLNRFISLLAPLRLRKECLSQRRLVEDAIKSGGFGSNRHIVINGDVNKMCDSAKVKEAYYNILKNAFEATENGDKIEVLIDKSSMVFRNKGNIPPHVLEHLFEPFFTTRDRGSGIGMYYVRKVMEAHGWKVRVSNENGIVEVKIGFNENSDC